MSKHTRRLAQLVFCLAELPAVCMHACMTFDCPCSLNERGLFDYLLLNDDLDATAAELSRIAQRAIAGLPAEPGQVPDEVRFEDGDDQQLDTGAAISGSGSPTSNAAAAAAAGIQAAAALPTFDSGAISISPPVKEALAAASAGHMTDSTTQEAADTAPHSNGAAVPAKPQQPQHQQPAEREQAQQWQQTEEQQQQPPVQQQQQHFDPVEQLPPEPLGPSGAAAAAVVATGLEARRGRVALVTGASSGETQTQHACRKQHVVASFLQPLTRSAAACRPVVQEGLGSFLFGYEMQDKRSSDVLLQCPVVQAWVDLSCGHGMLAVALTASRI